MCRVQQYPFTDDQAVMQADWELYIQVRMVVGSSGCRCLGVNEVCCFDQSWTHKLPSLGNKESTRGS